MLSAFHPSENAPTITNRFDPNGHLKAYMIQVNPLSDDLFH